MKNSVKIPVAMMWSGGKDSALALYKLMNDDRYDVRLLISTIHPEQKRVTMHGIRKELLEEQARRTGIPLYLMRFDGEDYDEKFTELLLKLKSHDIYHLAFGDIFLEDLRAYRDKLLAAEAIRGLYPLWKQEPKTVLDEFFSKGFRTVICCADADKLGEGWAGRELDRNAVSELPNGVDSCGENGEFHTFCFSGPVFYSPVKYSLGEKQLHQYHVGMTSGTSEQKGFWFADLLSR